MKILLISNSFGVNLQTYAKSIAQKNGLDLEIFTLYIGGCSLETHYNNIKEDKKAYQLYVDGNATDIFVSIDEALRLKDWDYVSLQQASHLSGNISSYYPYFGDIYIHVLTKMLKVKIMFHQTWAYSGKNPFKYDDVKTWLPSFKFNNDLEMKKGIDEALDRISKDYKIDLMVKSGDVIFEGMKVFDDLYDFEGFHLNKYGCYLIGLNLIKTLLNKKLNCIYIPEDLDEKFCKKALDFVNNL